MVDEQKLLDEMIRALKQYEDENVVKGLGEEVCIGAKTVLRGLIIMLGKGYFDKEDTEEEE